MPSLCFQSYHSLATQQLHPEIITGTIHKAIFLNLMCPIVFMEQMTSNIDQLLYEANSWFTPLNGTKQLCSRSESVCHKNTRTRRDSSAACIVCFSPAASFMENIKVFICYLLASSLGSGIMLKLLDECWMPMVFRTSTTLYTMILLLTLLNGPRNSPESPHCHSPEF